MKPTTIVGWVTSALFMALGHSPAHAFIDVSPDVTVVLDGATVHDEDVARLDGAVSFVNLGILPFASDVNGYWNGGDHVLISFATTVVLSGGVHVDPPMSFGSRVATPPSSSTAARMASCRTRSSMP